MSATDTHKVIYIHNGQIICRYITARDSYRFMGFTDTDYNKVIQVIPKSKVFFTAGNSISVECLQELFRSIFNANIL